MTDPIRRARILVNPVARHARRLDPHAAVRKLDCHGIDATVLVPGTVEDFRAEARRAADEQVELLFVAGGDGTLRLAAQEIAESETALAPIPVGTANVLAKEIGLPSGWDRAIDVHIRGQRVAMDLGTANNDVFLLMAGIGWDADITSRVSPGLKRMTGPFAYVVAGAARVPHLRSAPVDLRIDGQSHAGEWGLIVISNTRLYGGVVEFTPNALANDGLLDVCAVGPRRSGEGLALAARLVTQRLEEREGLHLDRGGEIEVGTPDLPVQLDGDVAGETPMRFGVRPGALRLSIPAGRLPALFQDSESGPKR